jgi:hypothetical protein
MGIKPLADLYATLGVSPAATPHALLLAYRGRIKKVHPDYAIDDADRVRRTETSAALNDAYAVLGDPVKRADYDRRRASPLSGLAGTRVVHSSGAPAEGAARSAARSSPSHDYSSPDVAPGVRWASTASTPFAPTLGAWLRVTPEGQWAALILAAIAIWLLGLVGGWPSPLWPDLTLLSMYLVAQPVLALRWRETPAAYLLSWTVRCIWWVAEGVCRLLARLVGRAPLSRV